MRGMLCRYLPVDTGDFRLVSSQCLGDLRTMRETHRFLRGMVAWMGYPQFAPRYRRAPRVAGTTKYPLRKTLSFAWIAATSFSTLPLKLSLFLGLVIAVFGIEEGIRALLERLLGRCTVPGWTSLIILTSVIGSSVLISVGLLGEYVGKIYEQSKQRPLYLVARTFNIPAPPEEERKVQDSFPERAR
jgi:polyisoprenyl-phosphate glycosyltransferase